MFIIYRRGFILQTNAKIVFTLKPSEIQPHLMANEIVASLFMREL